MTEVELKEWGNSMGVIIPIEKLKELGLQKGDKIELNIVKKRSMDGFGVCIRAEPFKEEKEDHEEFW